MLKGALGIVLASCFRLLIQALSMQLKTSIWHFWWKDKANSRIYPSSLLLHCLVSNGEESSTHFVFVGYWI